MMNAEWETNRRFTHDAALLCLIVGSVYWLTTETSWVAFKSQVLIIVVEMNE